MGELARGGEVEGGGILAGEGPPERGGGTMRDEAATALCAIVVAYRPSEATGRRPAAAELSLACVRLRTSLLWVIVSCSARERISGCS